MLHCNKYYAPTRRSKMDCKGLVKRLQNCFTNKSDVEQYIESRNPKTAADVEHLLQQYTYQNHKNWISNA
jgi:hypothetical protein